MNIIIYLLANYKYDIAEWAISNKKADEVFIPYIPSIHKEKSSGDLTEGVSFFPLDLLIKKDLKTC